MRGNIASYWSLLATTKEQSDPRQTQEKSMLSSTGWRIKFTKIND